MDAKVLKKFLSGMKSLKESLFDSKNQTVMESLFDKDLVEKNLPVFGDYYVVDKIESHFVGFTGFYDNNVSETIQNQVMKNFDYTKLKRDIKPVNLKKIQGYDNETLENLQYIIALINDIVIPEGERSSWNIFSEILKDELNIILKKYKNTKYGRPFMTMFINRDGLPYLRIGINKPFMWLEIYYKEKK